MADPFSIAASVVGLASFGLQVTNGITKYLDAIECRKSELESARNNLNALTQVLHIINKHANHLPLQANDASPSVVQSTLQLCTAELEALRALLAKLSGEGRDEAGVVGKVKKARRKLACPFDQDKLAQMGATLGQSVQTLHLALQVLAAQSSIVSTHVSITSMEEKLGYLTQIAERIERQQLYTQTLQIAYDTPAPKLITRRDHQVSESQLLGNLVSKPGRLRELCDSYGQYVPAEQSNGIFDPTQGLNHPEKFDTGPSSLIESPGSGLLACDCRRNRTLQRKSLSWSSLELFRDIRTDAYHLPSCPLSSFTNKVNQTWGMRHVTMSRLLGSAVQLSFSMAFGSGGFSMSPTINVQATVDKRLSPAFQAAAVFEDISTELFRASDLGRLHQNGIVQVETLFRAVMLTIATAYHQRKASPNDVDMDRETIIYSILRGIKQLGLIDMNVQQKALEILQGLMRYKIPVDHYATDGHSPFWIMMGTGMTSSLEVTRILFDGVSEIPLLLTRATTNVYVSVNILRHCSSIDDQRYLSLLAEAMGSGYLSKEILSNNHTRIQPLLDSCPDTLEERNLLGHSPLHLSAHKPLVLQWLLVSIDQRILDSTDTSGHTAVEYAILLSKHTCKDRHSPPRSCRRCGCSQSTVMLLRADCAITSQPNNLSRLLSAGSIRCKKRFVKGLKDRRDRLVALARESLPKSTFASLPLVEGCVLDSQAPLVYKALLDNGVRIPPPLSLSTDGDAKRLHGHWSSVYSDICNMQDAELFFRMGFCDIDAPDWRGLPPLANLNVFADVDYLAWLVNHGADPFRRLDPIHVPPHQSFTSSAYYLFLHLGTTFGEIDHCCHSVHSLNRTVFPVYLTDDCSCYCSDQGCTPFLTMLKAKIFSLENAITPPIKCTPEFIGRFISAYISVYHTDMGSTQYMDAVRYFTFISLGIQHTCRHTNLSTWNAGPIPEVLSADDIDHIHAEQHEMYELLESLIREFAAEMTELLARAGSHPAEIMRFWYYRWAKRMEEEIERLNGSDVPDDEKLAAEELGVVWHSQDPEPDLEAPYLRVGDPKFLESYLEQLDKIGLVENGK